MGLQNRAIDSIRKHIMNSRTDDQVKPFRKDHITLKYFMKIADSLSSCSSLSLVDKP